MSAEIGSDLLTVIVTLIGALTPTLPFIARLRKKIGTTRRLLGEIEIALADGKLTPAEVRKIVQTAKRVVGD